MKDNIDAEIHCNLEWTLELDQSILANASELKTGNILHLGKEYSLALRGNEKLWISSKLVKIRYDSKNLLPEDLGFTTKARNMSGRTNTTSNMVCLSDT